MSIETALKTWLETDPDVQRITAGRIYPDKRPQSTKGDLPCVVYWKSGRTTARSLSGLSGLSNPRFAIDCRAELYQEACQLADLIRGNKTTPKLDGFRGRIGDTRIQCCKLLDDADTVEAPAHGEETGGAHVTLEFEIHYEDV